MVHCAGAKKGSALRKKKGFHRGGTYSILLLEAFKLFVRAEEKSFNRCSGCAVGWKLGDNLLSFDYSVEYAALINQRSWLF